MSERVPPHNLRAERALLGELLSSRNAREISLPLVAISDFYQDSYGLIFDAIRCLYNQGEVIDVATVSDVLMRQNCLEFVGGVTELHHIRNDSLCTDGRSHAQIIIDHARMRDIIKICTGGTQGAYDCPDDVSTLIEHLIAEFEGLELPLGKLPDGLWTVEDFMARSKEERPQWVIRGLLREGWRVCVVAVEGFGKTVLLHQLALCAARGIHPFIPDCEIPSVTTLLVDCENPEDRLDDGFEYIMPRLDQLKPVIPGTAYLWSQPGGIDLRTRADRSALEAIIAYVHPKIVCAGPVYKTFLPQKGDDHATVAREVQAVWDNLRTRYKFALVLEAHASKGSGGVRNMDMEGSAYWLRWSEFGLKCLRDDQLNRADQNVYYKVDRFRLDRIRDHGWPSGLERAISGMPWGAKWADDKWREYIADDLADVVPPPPPLLPESEDDPF